VLPPRDAESERHKHTLIGRILQEVDLKISQEVNEAEFIFNQKVLFEAVENAIICKIEDLKNVFDSIENYPKSTITHRGDIKPLLEQILGK